MANYDIDYKSTHVISGITAYSDILEPNKDFGKHGIGLRITDSQAEKLEAWAEEHLERAKVLFKKRPKLALRDSEDKEGNKLDGKFVKVSWKPGGPRPLLIFDAHGNRMVLDAEPPVGSKLQVQVRAFLSKIPSGGVFCTLQPAAIRIIELAPAAQEYDEADWGDSGFDIPEKTDEESADFGDPDSAEDFL